MHLDEVRVLWQFVSCFMIYHNLVLVMCVLNNVLRGVFVPVRSLRNSKPLISGSAFIVGYECLAVGYVHACYIGIPICM